MRHQTRAIVGALPALVLGPSVFACGTGPNVEVGIYDAPGDGPAASEGDAGGASGTTFDWPEAEAQQGICAPGEYLGEFSCAMTFGGVLPSGPISGPIAFVLEESLVREFLEITSGQLRGFAGLVVFSSELDGKLDCKTNEFSAISINGQYPGGTFSGTLEGTLDRATQTLSGTWALGATGSPPCVGDFRVVRTQ